MDSDDSGYESEDFCHCDCVCANPCNCGNVCDCENCDCECLCGRGGCECVICERYLRHCDREHEGFVDDDCDRCTFYDENCLDRHELDGCEICSHYREHRERDPDCNCAICIYYREWIDV